MIPGLLLGIGGGALSVWSLWLITGFTARASRGLSVSAPAERPSGWDAEAQDPDVVTAGQWIRALREEKAEASNEISEATLASGGPTEFRNAALRISAAFLLKLPILVLVASAARSLGTDSLYWCVGGVVSVYSLAVLWAAGRTHRR